MTKIEPAQSAQPSTATARRVYIETYGCQMNVADSEVVASIMQMDGFHLTEDPELADAIFLNTCSVRDNAEQKVLNRTRLLSLHPPQEAPPYHHRRPRLYGGAC